MKKVLLSFLFGTFMAAFVQAQSTPEPPMTETPKGEASEMPSAENQLTDVHVLAKNLLTIMTPKLGLTTEQSPKVLTSVTTFLTAKLGILPLMERDPKTYSDKFGVIHGDMMKGLKVILTPQQVTQFMGLMPKENDPKNVMNHLFF
jgi:hypothetical protein